MRSRRRIGLTASIALFTLFCAAGSAMIGLSHMPSASAWCDSSEPDGICSCGVNMPPPHTGPNGGSCDPICLGPGYPGCGCYGGTWVGDCGGSGSPPPGPPPPPPCVPDCTGKVCGQTNGCPPGVCPGPTANDGVCCPQEVKGLPGYVCADCSACGNKVNDGLKVGCFCSDPNCPVGGRP